MIRQLNILSFGIALIFLCSCKTRITSVEEFNKWLNNDSHGCVKERQIERIRLSVKYQPTSYLVLKELENHKNDKMNIDSLLKDKNAGLTFIMTLGTSQNDDNERRPASIMYEAIGSYKEYAQRVLEMNFSMEQYIKLYIDGKEFKPVLAFVENVYELSDNRNFVVVFATKNNNELIKGKDYLFVYDDPYFKIGKIQFDFNGSDLEQARNITIARN